ncbi:MAG: hypothetical protein HKN67_13250 [Saprospiraceae bacterium]|nr:hypothetical protein [Saprospiraceae bacterium]
MKTHFDLSDHEFEMKFSNCSLDPDLFSHEAHLRLAWIHIKRYGIHIATNNIRKQLKNYTKSVGAQSKYNETVTIAAVKAVYHFYLASRQETFKAFINENKQLLDNFRGLLLSHYKTDIFNSEKARRQFIEPELIPFDL